MNCGVRQCTNRMFLVLLPKPETAGSGKIFQIKIVRREDNPMNYLKLLLISWLIASVGTIEMPIFAMEEETDQLERDWTEISYEGKKIDQALNKISNEALGGILRKSIGLESLLSEVEKTITIIDNLLQKARQFKRVSGYTRTERNRVQELRQITIIKDLEEQKLRLENKAVEIKNELESLKKQYVKEYTQEARQQRKLKLQARPKKEKAPEKEDWETEFVEIPSATEQEEYYQPKKRGWFW